MRKIELDAHIKKEGIEDLQEYGFSRAKLKIGHTGELDYYNVTLTVIIPDEPGRKVLITEKEFDESVYDIFHSATLRGDGYEIIKNKLKQKLFGTN